MDEATKTDGDSTRPYDQEIRRIEFLSTELWPLWRSEQRRSKREVACSIREFLHEHYETDDALGEVLAVMAWRKSRQTADHAFFERYSFDFSERPLNTFCRWVVGISERRACFLGLALRAFDIADVALDQTRVVLDEMGGIKAAAEGHKAVSRTMKKLRKAGLPAAKASQVKKLLR